MIPTSDIDWEARCIAVRWLENYEKIGVIEMEQKHKLASDIMNYARHQLESTQAELSRLKEVAEKMVEIIETSTHVGWFEEGLNGDEVLAEYQTILEGEKK